MRLCVERRCSGFSGESEACPRLVRSLAGCGEVGVSPPPNAQSGIAYQAMAVARAHLNASPFSSLNWSQYTCTQGHAFSHAPLARRACCMRACCRSTMHCEQLYAFRLHAPRHRPGCHPSYSIKSESRVYTASAWQCTGAPGCFTTSGSTSDH